MSKSSLKGRVIKAVTSRYNVDTKDGVKIVPARKKVKNIGEILVGDIVEIVRQNGTFIIEKVYPRKNQLIRPYVANVDVCLIVIAPLPEPDFLLVDKIIVNCLLEHIIPILVANKSDLGKINEIDEYKGIVDVLHCSAHNGSGIQELVEKTEGKTVCFAGQSAVGKSSIINVILNADKQKTAELAKKTMRGKHTTRQTEILNAGKCFLIDTCGFSLLDTVEIEPTELRLYYDEFEPLRPLCKYRGCTHIDEPDCAVKSEIGVSVAPGRYERYKVIYDELTERKNKKFS